MVVNIYFGSILSKATRQVRLTLHTDYALRVLLYAALKPSQLCTIPELARHFDISRGHLMKVVHGLARTGYLQTTRGKNGGFRLARPPGDIGVGEVVRDMEPELGVLGCLQDKAGYCRIEECCVLRRALRDATAAFLATLDRYTIADLIEPRRALLGLLHIGDPDESRRPASASARR
jgi:Rrf2 family transcriptional regulator, nitric oxide-sensitive transcriptional repressor